MAKSGSGDGWGSAHGERRRLTSIFDRWPNFSVLLVVVLLVGIGAGAWLASANRTNSKEVLIQPTDSVGSASQLASQSPPPAGPPPANGGPPSVQCAPAFVANTLPDTGSSAGGSLGLKSIASSVHTGYDRVVFTLGGSGQPGWRVEYVTSPTSDASGDPVAVAGTATLRVIIKNVGYPADTGVADMTVDRFTPSGTVVVSEVVRDTVWEGQATAFIGVTSTLPFRVFPLSSPTPRLVVDVRHC